MEIPMHALVLAALLFSPSPVLAQDSRDTVVAKAAAPAAADVVPTGDDGAARMTVPVMVNGQGPFSFVIDTGADRTVVSRELAERLALRKAGNVRLHAMGGSGRVDVVKVDHLQISPRVSRRLEAAALPRRYMGQMGYWVLIA
jgi:predicted aspartyl protease